MVFPFKFCHISAFLLKTCLSYTFKGYTQGKTQCPNILGNPKFAKKQIHFGIFGQYLRCPWVFCHDLCFVPGPYKDHFVGGALFLNGTFFAKIFFSPILLKLGQNGLLCFIWFKKKKKKVWPNSFFFFLHNSSFSHQKYVYKFTPFPLVIFIARNWRELVWHIAFKARISSG